MLALAWRLRRGREDIYLRIGELTAKVQPTAWFSVAGVPLRWRLLGPVVGLVSAVCVWGYVRWAGQAATHWQPMALWAMLFAAVNAFVEESIFRSALVSTISPYFGAGNEVLVSAVIFGAGHWNGLPYGAPGVAMTFVLGIFAAKAMVETKGMLWSWFMHALPDYVIFYYWGIGSIRHASIGG